MVAEGKAGARWLKEQRLTEELEVRLYAPIEPSQLVQTFRGREAVVHLVAGLAESLVKGEAAHQHDITGPGCTGRPVGSRSRYPNMVHA
jgi:hypothetical protein